jgi:hypothetical protein
VNAELVAQGVASTPYVGMAIFEAESVEKIFEVFKDPEYLRVVVPDEMKLIDREKSSLVAGQVATIMGQ